MLQRAPGTALGAPALRRAAPLSWEKPWGGGTPVVLGFLLPAAPFSTEESAASFMDTWRSWKK